MSQNGRKILLISRQNASMLIRVQMKTKKPKIQCAVLELYVSVEDLMYSCCQVTYIRPRNLMFSFFFFPLFLEALGANILNETFASMEPINNTS